MSPSTQAPPDDLQLKAGPRQVTRINRRLLILIAAIGLAGIALLVLIALQPPSWRNVPPPELVTVEARPVTDRLSELPPSYDAAGSPLKPPPGAAVVPKPEVLPLGDPTGLDGDALKSPVFFRLQLKEPANRADTGPQNATGLSSPSGGIATYDPISAARRATERAQALAAGDTAPPDNGAASQDRKLSFLKQDSAREIYNPHQLEKPVSPYQLLAGSIIPASLLSGLNSDLPGFVIAQVTEHVFDSVTGRHLLIPQGSRLIGRYDSVVAFGQERALVIWQRIIRPDGASIVIDNLPATDTGGYAGLADQIDLHSWKLLKGVALATVLGIGSSLAFGAGSGDSDIISALREATGQTTNRAGQALVERNLSVQPTITVRPGWPLRVVVHKDLLLAPYRE
ncbi:TrbI/VirB10 family protein [Rhodomicrobium sp. R_RK_3]|uniref:TrbI/VirB10 family protein n=1 Tax=Rhodomicrobium sp. R_RK_3 TaxID=2029567 RepID=UPI000B4AC5A2|nr:TrbI/VirB10 family protein [Rhodomicrobium sp. R_RK_3]